MTTKNKPIVELGEEWKELATAAHTLNSTRKSKAILEEQEDTLRNRIKEILFEFEIDEATLFKMAGVSVTLTPTKGRKTLNKDMLIDAGVLPSVIEKGYKVGEGHVSVSVDLS